MDPAPDMIDPKEVGDDAPPPGSAARALGKAALVAYWLVCLTVIAVGLSRMERRWPHAGTPEPAVAAAPAGPVRAAVRSAPPGPRLPAPHPARPAGGESEVWPGLAPPPASAAIVGLLSIFALVILVRRPWRRRGSRQFGRFSGRGRRLGSMRGFGSGGF
jgi:hypothetical protein